jgi:cell division protein FtsA
LAKTQPNLFLELGCANFRASLVSFDSSREPIVRLYSVPSRGIKNGAVIDVNASVEALMELLEAVDGENGLKISRCCLLIPPSCSTTRTAESKLSLNGLTVSTDHAERLSHEIIMSAGDDTCEVVELSEQVWRLDDAAYSSIPIGKTGRTLNLSTFCCLIDKQILAGLVTTCNNAGLSVGSTYSTLIGAKKLIYRLSPQASNRVILDLGHTTTSGIICVGNKENSTFTIRAGSQHITRDVAAGLQCDTKNAEYLKLNVGLRILNSDLKALPAPSSEVYTAPLNPAFDELSLLEISRSSESEQISTSIIYPWAAPRVAEIFTLCLRNFAIYAKALDGGIVLTGGGSQLAEISLFLSNRLRGLKVTRFKPTRDGLSKALKTNISCPANLSLCGFEGILEHSFLFADDLKKRHSELPTHTPKMLRPLLTWFIELSK